MPSCEHIVAYGPRNLFEEQDNYCFPLTLEEIQGMKYRESLQDCFDIFNYCPKCGEKLDANLRI